jgi:hypothetical protein
MTTKPAFQKILKGVLYREEEKYTQLHELGKEFISPENR